MNQPDRDHTTVTGESWLQAAQQAVVSQHPHIQSMLQANPSWTDQLLIPQRVTIETFFGCNAHCTMCVIDFPTHRRKGVMSMELFYKIVDGLLPYRDQIEMMDLTALGEPLLDKYLFERIRHLKQNGFRRLAFATNADLLSEDKQQALLESGIDTVMFSIDGFCKETHEAIRVGVDYDRVVNHCLSTIARRNAGNYSTRFLVRFVRQEANRGEWEAYRHFWRQNIVPERGDQISCYDMHTWGGQVGSRQEMVNDPFPEEIALEPCHHIFRKLTILADGSLALCSEDLLTAQFNLANVREQDPIAAFNAPRLQAMRALHLSGQKNRLKICSECTILYCERKRVIE
ncbi:MAG: radical SAM protein [Magnetococcales bacterium]|nr:radical SAM protein [Magnetococcales bacterium]